MVKFKAHGRLVNSKPQGEGRRGSTPQVLAKLYVALQLLWVSVSLTTSRHLIS